MFPEGTKVKLVRTGTDNLDGLIGTVRGCSENQIGLLGWGSYIIQFESEDLKKLQENDYEYSCIHITDACVESI